MTNLRASLNPVNAEKFIDIFQDIYNNRRDVIVPYSKATTMSPDTLHHRMSEALLYLMMVENPPIEKVTLKTAQFAELRGLVKFKKELKGIRITFQRYMAVPTNMKKRLNIADTLTAVTDDLGQIVNELELIRVKKEQTSDPALIASLESKETSLLDSIEAKEREVIAKTEKETGVTDLDPLYQEIVEFLNNDKEMEFFRRGLNNIGGLPIIGERKGRIMDLLLGLNNIQYLVNDSDITIIKG